ncbi:MAG: hypothetical protein ABIV48_02810 [Pyrinomonadaceae bacterium]
MNLPILSSHRFLLLAKSLVLLLAFTIFAMGQVNTSSREEWDRYQTIAQRILKDNPFRMKMTVETRPTEKDEWTFYSYQEIEEIRPDRSHTRVRAGYYEAVIWIGATSYSKRPNAGWIVRTPDAQASTIATVATVRDLSKPVFEFSNLGVRYLDGEQMTVLQMVRKVERLNLRNGTVDDFPSTTRYWFDKLGRYRRFENIHFTSSVPGPRFIRTRRDYEYDPNIKIEAPIN